MDCLDALPRGGPGTWVSVLLWLMLVVAGAGLVLAAWRRDALSAGAAAVGFVLGAAGVFVAVPSASAAHAEAVEERTEAVEVREARADREPDVADRCPPPPAPVDREAPAAGWVGRLTVR